MRWSTFILLLTFSLPLWSQSPGEIRGTCTDETGKTFLKNVRILILNTGDTLRSDSTGKFQIKVKPGVLNLVYNYPGYQTDTALVIVDAGKTTYITIKLQPPQAKEKKRRKKSRERNRSAAFNSYRSLVPEECSAYQYPEFHTGSVRGFVRDSSTGEGIPFALVLYADSAGVQCDMNGYFEIHNLNTGSHTIRARANAFRADTVAIMVNADTSVELNFTLGRIVISCPVIVLKDSTAEPVPVVELQPGFMLHRFLLLAGAETALSVGSLIWLNNVWYSDYSTGKFHTFDDNREWLQMDKIGHAQTAYTTGLISYSLLRWSGVRYRKSVWAGGLTGFTYLTAIEIMDGYSEGWGFSSGDMIANATGSALFISQQLVWGEQRILPKFGFQRSGYAPYRPELLGDGFSEELLKDYNGQTYWLSVNVASFLKEESRFPKWLNVAVGYGANGMTGGHENPVMYNSQGNAITFERYRQYYFSLDIDLRKLPVRNRFLRALFTCISFIKIPAPGIELSKNGVRPLLFAF